MLITGVYHHAPQGFKRITFTPEDGVFRRIVPDEDCNVYEASTILVDCGIYVTTVGNLKRYAFAPTWNWKNIYTVAESVQHAVRISVLPTACLA